MRQLIFIFIFVFSVGSSALHGQEDLLMVSQEQYRQKQAGDAIAMLEPVARWNGKDLSPSAGLPVFSWVDVVGGRNLEPQGEPPTVEVFNGQKAVKFDGSNPLNLAEDAAIDFQPTVNAFTIVVRVANVLTNGTLVSKTDDSSTGIQYKMSIENSTTYKVRHTLGQGAVTERFVEYTAPNLSNNAVYIMTVGTTDNNDAQFYYDGNSLGVPTSQGTSSRMGSNTGNGKLWIGSTKGNIATLDNFTGSISDIYIFDKELTPEEVDIVTNYLGYAPM